MNPLTDEELERLKPIIEPRLLVIQRLSKILDVSQGLVGTALVDAGTVQGVAMLSARLDEMETHLVDIKKLLIEIRSLTS